MAMKLSYHASAERTNRLAFIATTIGFGEEISRRYRPKNDTEAILTDTGVIIIESVKNKIVVTAYIATMVQAKSIYKGTLPPRLRKTIQSNIKKKLIELQEEY